MHLIAAKQRLPGEWVLNGFHWHTTCYLITVCSEPPKNFKQEKESLFMPLYEYKCEECGAVFEELMSVGASDSPPCPECKSSSTTKQISAFGGLAGGNGGACARSGFT